MKKKKHKPRTDNPQNPETKGTQDEEKKPKAYMCWTSIHANKYK